MARYSRDVASTFIETDDLEGFDKQGYIDEHWASFNQDNPVYDEQYTKDVLAKIKEAKRPVIMAGTAIRHANQQNEFIKCIESLEFQLLQRGMHTILYGMSTHYIVEDPYSRQGSR